MKVINFTKGMFNSFGQPKRSVSKRQTSMKHPEIFTLLEHCRNVHNLHNFEPQLSTNLEAYKFLHSSFQQVQDDSILTSYESGLDLLDNLSPKTFLLLEHLNVRINVFRFVWISNGNKVTSRSNLSYKKTGLMHKHNKGFIASTYVSNIPDHSLPIVNVLLVNQCKNTVRYPVIYIINENKIQLFFKTFKPAAGSPYNTYVCSVKNKLSRKKLLKKSNVHIAEKKVSIHDIYNQTCTLTPLNCNLVFFAIQNFSLTKPRKKDSDNYNFISWFKNENLKTSIFKVVLLERCPSKIKLWFPPKVVEEQLITFMSPSNQRFTKIKKEPIKNLHPIENDWKQCFCELDSPDKFIQQRPLQFYTKSLRPRLETFNLFSVANQNLLNLASYFNLATFDIESISKPGPAANITNKKIGFFYRMGKEINCETDKQELIMIGVTTTLTDNIVSWLRQDQSDNHTVEIEQRQDSTITQIFHLENNHLPNRKSEPNFRNQTLLVEKFLRYVYSKAVDAANAKAKILRPIYKQISYLKKQHKDLTDTVLEFLPKNTSKGFDDITKLQIAFDSFINEYVILGFNSSRYDVPILLPYIKALVNNDRNDLFHFKNIKIFRKGLRVNSLQIKHKGILLHFRDFLALEAPASLRATGEKYGLNVHKGHFPHKFATSINILKTTRDIPRDINYWKSLQDELPSENIILEAEFSFRMSRSSNLYNYMTHYLRLDCIVLFKCFTAFHKLLQSIEGVNIFLHKRYTISSLMYNKNYIEKFSSDPMQMPPFEINHTSHKFINRVLSESIIGGITQASFIGTAGCQPNKTFTKINSHLRVQNVSSLREKNNPGLYKLYHKKKNCHEEDTLIENPLDGKYVKCLDVSSLYASSMLKGKV